MSLTASSKETMTNEIATKLIELATQKATEKGIPSSIAVVDESGNLVAFSRMNGAALMTIEIATDKAYTAAAFGLATDAWHDFVKDDAPLAMGAPTGINRLIVFGGGLPVETPQGGRIGGIGLSGGHWSDDKEIASYALENLHLS